MNKRGMNKKAQLTYFIIIAIIIAAALLAFFWRDIRVIIEKTDSPQSYLENCIDKKLKEGVSLASQRGGSISPVNSIMFNNNEVEYLCYTNEYYDTCTMQQPMLKRHFEYEVSKYIESDVRDCVSSFQKEFERRGYSVSVGRVSVSTELVPNNINVNIKAPITLTKESSASYEKVEAKFKSNMYDLIMLSTSILNWEARYGDSDPVSFMIYYPDLKIQKLKQGDGSKIYILTDMSSDESFVFATRSLSWPGGYGIGEKVNT